MAATLYLNFDGVLHPQRVCLQAGAKPRLLVPGHTLFENNPLLERVVDARPSVRVVLHTWWVPYFGYQFATQQLPLAVRSRVVGATLPGNRTLRLTKRPLAPRREWLRADIARRQPESPILVDCEDGQVLACLTDRALILHDGLGLSTSSLCEILIGLLDCI
ncbi:HAD domain-containing protein [Ralstonia condita]|uniref:HAD domain-containing protein n=1 Tax=Ralstonia condita TaxID=3058600 RepID=UPI003D183AA4